MGPTPMYQPPRGEGCETWVEQGLPLWAGPDGGYCSRQPSPPPTWGSRFVGARELGPWVGEPKLQGRSSLWGQPQSQHDLPIYLPASLDNAGRRSHQGDNLSLPLP